MDKWLQKQLVDRPAWDAGDTCLICGSPYIHKHHVFYGSLRKNADKRGYIVPLCPKHHMMVHEKRGIGGYERAWRELAQKHYEKHIGSREDFIKEFEKSYL